MNDAIDRSIPPSAHSGPGFANAEAPPQAELRGDKLNELVLAWINILPSRSIEEGDDEVEDGIAALDRAALHCREHPYRALVAAHHHLRDDSPEIRLRALALASEALCFLDHFADALEAAEAALRLHPSSPQARWRAAVALYRLGRFSTARQHLDRLLAHTTDFAPAWALRGQVKLWLNHDDVHSADTDFSAAAELDPKTWVVPFRMSQGDFRKAVFAAVGDFAGDTGDSFAVPDIDVEMLPRPQDVVLGCDPDIRGRYFNPRDQSPENPLAQMYGGDFDAGGRTAVLPGARFVFYQRNIENLCGSAERFQQEIVKSIAQEYSGALRMHAKTIAGAPENHAENAGMPEFAGES